MVLPTIFNCILSLRVKPHRTIVGIVHGGTIQFYIAIAVARKYREYNVSKDIDWVALY